MREGFNKLIIGFVFLFFDFRLQNIDVLPDPIGYLFIFLGMTALMGFIKEFEQSRNIAIVLLVLSIPGVINIKHGVDLSTNNGLTSSFDLGYMFVLGILTSILSVVLMYYLFIGISRKAKFHNFYDLARLSHVTWVLVLVINIGLYTTMLIPFIAIPLILGGLGVLVLEFVVLTKAKNAFINLETSEIIE
ncbi:hypothetical protein [Haloplasma contractile]|uniref:Uncharacterized protein n=1 Tax=Haloplasma contractile SSD-17B TaxID=1033810 RepID=U2FIW2_9MOLU|nr:hypothetical protein [Haloplasma contractile]ERJ11199.1 hypothetical protein HLPCO_002768 [Haloplasma contractile SSD-17B]